MRQNRIDVSLSSSPHSRINRSFRVLWWLAHNLLFRTSPRMLWGWRRFLVRLFGGKIGKGVKLYPGCRIWAPWNLEMGDYSCLSYAVDCYNLDRIAIGAHTLVSQYCFLCAAAHDESDPGMKLIKAPIIIEDQVWICSDVFVGMGVTIGEGAVVGARSSVFRDLEPWKVYAGSPAGALRERHVRVNN